MRQLMVDWLYTMLYSGCICALLLYICPGGKLRELLEIGTACVMLLAFLSPVTQWKQDGYDRILEEFLSAQKVQEEAMVKSSQEIRDGLIIEEYRTYICSEAAEQGIPLEDVQVMTDTSESGYPVPVELRYISGEQIAQTFQEQMALQLGVALERQFTYETTMEAMAGGSKEQ